MIERPIEVPAPPKAPEYPKPRQAAPQTAAGRIIENAFAFANSPEAGQLPSKAVKQEREFDLEAFRAEVADSSNLWLDDRESNASDGSAEMDLKQGVILSEMARRRERYGALFDYKVAQEQLAELRDDAEYAKGARELLALIRDGEGHNAEMQDFLRRLNKITARSLAKLITFIDAGKSNAEIGQDWEIVGRGSGPMDLYMQYDGLRMLLHELKRRKEAGGKQERVDRSEAAGLEAILKLHADDFDEGAELSSPMDMLQKLTMIEQECQRLGLTDVYIGLPERSRPLGQIKEQLQALWKEQAATGKKLAEMAAAGKTKEEMSVYLKGTSGPLATVSAVRLWAGGKSLRDALSDYFLVTYAK